jgi:phosphate starvation-inducible PhoH-like protein
VKGSSLVCAAARLVDPAGGGEPLLVTTRDSGLKHALRILEDVKGVGVQRFQAQDVVRHAMVERIVRAYDADAAAHRPAADLEDPDA